MATSIYLRSSDPIGLERMRFVRSWSRGVFFSSFSEGQGLEGEGGADGDLLRLEEVGKVDCDERH